MTFANVRLFVDICVKIIDYVVFAAAPLQDPFRDDADGPPGISASRSGTDTGHFRHLRHAVHRGRLYAKVPNEEKDCRVRLCEKGIFMKSMG